MRVQRLQVGQAHELRDVGLIADVALAARLAITPLPGRLAEQGYVQQVGFARVDQGGLLWGDLGWNEVLLDGVGVNAVVDLGEVAADVPTELIALPFLEALELLDEVELELDRNPGRELEGNVLVGVRPAIAPSLGCDANGASAFDPLLGREGEAVQPGSQSNPCLLYTSRCV